MNKVCVFCKRQLDPYYDGLGSACDCMLDKMRCIGCGGIVLLSHTHGISHWQDSTSVGIYEHIPCGVVTEHECVDLRMELEKYIPEENENFTHPNDININLPCGCNVRFLYKSEPEYSDFIPRFCDACKESLGF